MSDRGRCRFDISLASWVIGVGFQTRPWVEWWVGLGPVVFGWSA